MTHSLSFNLKSPWNLIIFCLYMDSHQKAFSKKQLQGNIYQLSSHIIFNDKFLEHKSMEIRSM